MKETTQVTGQSEQCENTLGANVTPFYCTFSDFVWKWGEKIFYWCSLSFILDIASFLPHTNSAVNKLSVNTCVANVHAVKVLQVLEEHKKKGSVVWV